MVRGWVNEKKKSTSADDRWTFDMIMYFLSSHLVLKMVRYMRKRSERAFIFSFHKSLKIILIFLLEWILPTHFFTAVILVWNVDWVSFQQSDRRFYFWFGCRDEKMKSSLFSKLKVVKKWRLLDYEWKTSIVCLCNIGSRYWYDCVWCGLLCVFLPTLLL